MIYSLFATFAVCAETHDMKQTRSDFEKFAAELPYLYVGSVLYDRPNHHFQVADSKIREKHFRILFGKVTDGTYPRDALLGLLTHSNPKVRTLAAVALFDREDPSVLPSLANLCDDKSATFDGYPELSANFLKFSGIVPSSTEKKQTVGDVAKKMVAFYMERSGIYYGLNHKIQPCFSEYWQVRKNRSHCAGWFLVQLARASQCASPTQKDCIDRIRTLRGRIDKLPLDERTWILLWLNGENGSDALVTEDELVKMCKSLGPDKLLLMLYNKIPSDDPDLQPRTNNNWPYKRMAIFVLCHAEQLFRRSDSDALLACERWQSDYEKHKNIRPVITPWWAVAGAGLKPVNASRILHAAMNRFQGKFNSDERATLCIAMWRLCGKSEMEFILNWFYKGILSQERGSFSNSRGLFIETIGKEPDGREIISQLIRDKRLVDIDWQSLERLVRVVSVWTGTPIVTEEEIRKVWHPLGQGHYHWEKDKAKKDYPKETEELEAHLSEWRKRLRMSIPKLLDSDIEKKKKIVEQRASENRTN